MNLFEHKCSEHQKLDSLGHKYLKLAIGNQKIWRDICLDLYPKENKFRN